MTPSIMYLMTSTVPCPPGTSLKKALLAIKKPDYLPSPRIKSTIKIIIIIIDMIPKMVENP